jgi:DNA-binding winged helix-turn-helix (wHTH) protein/tetratricopeptide (TPR) repeat protein
MAALEWVVAEPVPPSTSKESVDVQGLPLASTEALINLSWIFVYARKPFEPNELPCWNEAAVWTETQSIAYDLARRPRFKQLSACMASPDGTPTALQFDEFRLDLRSLELRKHGLRIRLRRQPAQVLALLAGRPGELVAREEIQRQLWGTDTFVDFERGLNNCVKQIRQALNDGAESPKYIETIPRQGYRFLAEVKALNGNHLNASAAANLSSPNVRETAAPTPVRAPDVAAESFWKPRAIWIAAIFLVAAVVAVAHWGFIGVPALSFQDRDSILITDFENHTGDPRFDNALMTAFMVSIEQSRHANVVPRSRVEAALKRMGKSSKEQVTAEIGREICQRDGIRGLVTVEITRTGRQFGLTAQLLDPASGAPARSYSERIAGEDHVLDALDRIAGEIRADLGESLYQIHRANRPLPQVTTASLTALKRYADGQALWHSNKFSEAVAQFHEATTLDPDFAMAHAALGNAYCSHVLGYQREVGATEYQKALSLTSRVTDRERRMIGVGYASSMGHVADANKLSRVYLSDYPDDWAVRYSYANGLRKQGDELEAVEQYKELQRIAPEDGNLEIQIATAYKTLGKPAEAIAAYGEAFRIDPAILNVANINREYGFTLITNGEEAEAEQVFSDFAAQPGKLSAGLDSLALLDLMHGKYAKAEERLERALSAAEQMRDPFLVARNHFFLAVVAQGEGNRTKELKQLDAALADFAELGPKVEYGSLVGQEYARGGAVDKAEKIERLIAPLADPNSDEQGGYIRLLQGEILSAKGAPLEAAKLLDLQDQRYGESIISISIEAVARSYEKAGKTDEAISWYEKLVTKTGCRLLSWEPQQRCVEARLALANDFLARGDKQKAESALAPLLSDWRDADPSLPLKKQAVELASQASK